MNTPKADRRIAYLVKTFPKISETFVVREILALERQGVDLAIYALRRPEESKSHSINGAVRARVSYLPAVLAENRFGLLWTQLILLLRRPIRYVQALLFALGRAEAGRGKDFLQATYLARELVRTKIAHLHAHFINEPAGVAELAHRLSGIPYSVTAHAKDIYLSPQAELVRKMTRAKFVVTCNDYNRRYLEAMAVQGTPIVKIYHGLDAELFSTDAAVDPAAGAPLLLSVGRLRPKKGFHVLLDACGLLKIGGHKFRCVIAGYGPLREELEKRMAKLGLGDTVSLTGMLTQEEVIALYKQASLFVLPCQITADGDRDGIPNVLAEAMAMELPVVTTNVAGIPELVEHDRSGILVRSEDPVELAAAIARLLDQPQLRRRLGKAGREKVCRLFAAEKNAAQLKGHFFDAPGQRVEPAIMGSGMVETPSAGMPL
jgi:glycosyltransferase involved in cell wall biosynthesis